MIRVFVVASTPAARERLRALLVADGLRVAGTAPPGRWEEMPPGTDVLVAGDEGALVGLEALTRDGDESAPAVVLLARSGRALEALRDLSPRGWAAVPSEPSAKELGAAVRAAAAGMMAVPVSLGAGLAADEHPGGDVSGNGFEEALTAREREVLERLADGMSNREIAVRLGISEHTVKFHVSSIYGKLGVSGRAEAVRQGVRRGLISL